MVKLYIDFDQTLLKFTNYLAYQHHGIAEGNQITFNDADVGEALVNQTEAIESMKKFPFFRHSYNMTVGHTFPTMLLRTTMLNSDEVFDLCTKMGRISCLVIGSSLPNRKIDFMHPTIMRYIKTLENDLTTKEKVV